jgi:hypothetical protein
MGYGNPLFDGDEPLPPLDPQQRIVSMRLLFRGLRARTPGERAGLADRHDDENGGPDGTRNLRAQDQGEDQRG